MVRLRPMFKSTFFALIFAPLIVVSLPDTIERLFPPLIMLFTLFTELVSLDEFDADALADALAFTPVIPTPTFTPIDALELLDFVFSLYSSSADFIVTPSVAFNDALLVPVISEP